MRQDRGKKVLVALSGGVDSAVAALLLQEQGYEVAGVTMCLGIRDDATSSVVRCCGREAVEGARMLCDRLSLPHHVLNYASEFEALVVSPFVAAYRRGQTPNPCVECNRHLKFGSLLQTAFLLGYDFLATGHYAGIAESGGRLFIQKARDRRKDQSYFLYALDPAALGSMIFPLAGMTKDEVRVRARAAKLPVAAREESQDICFVTGSYGDFVAAKLGEDAPPPGNIVDVTGRKLGRHRGIVHYTLGQRSGLGVSAKAPLYVLRIDVRTDTIVVGEKSQTLAKALVATDVNLFTTAEALPRRLQAKLRYGSRAEDCEVRLEGSRLVVNFAKPQAAITPGQSVVLYSEEELVLGGGIIAEVVAEGITGAGDGLR